MQTNPPTPQRVERVGTTLTTLITMTTMTDNDDDDDDDSLCWFTPLPPWGPNLLPYPPLMVGLWFPYGSLMVGLWLGYGSLIPPLTNAKYHHQNLEKHRKLRVKMDLRALSPARDALQSHQTL